MTTETDESTETNRLAGVQELSESQTANAHARINVPLNLNNWKHLPQEVAGQLLWFHQHCLDESFDINEAASAVGYSANAVYQVLRGVYNGNYKQFCAGIASYKKALAKRESIQNSEFVETRNTRLITNALDYAMAANSMVLITGESGSSKTMTCDYWAKENNHGQTVMVDATEIGGAKGLLMEICGKIGANRTQSILGMRQSIHKAFNRNRMLIIDEGTRLLPSDYRTIPTSIEFLRTLHDKTKCAVAISVTRRFTGDLEKNDYQYEQFLGRIGMPVRLFPTLESEDVAPLLAQYFGKVSDEVLKTALAIANNELKEYKGRLRTLVELLRFAAMLAKKENSKVTDKIFFKTMAIRKKMLGATQIAKD